MNEMFGRHESTLNKCSECKAVNSFTYDSQHAHYTCTCCGIVPNRFYTDMELGHSFQASYMPPDNSIPATKKTKLEIERASQLLNNVFYDEFKMDTCKKKLEEFGALLSCNSRIIETCEGIVEKHNKLVDNGQGVMVNKNEILDLKNIDTTCVGLLVIVSQQRKKFLSVSLAQKMANRKCLNKKMKRLCKILNVKVANTALSKLGIVCSTLQIPFKKQKIVKECFLNLKSKNQSIGEDTLLCYAIHNKVPTLSLKDVCAAVNVNINTVETYIRNHTLNE